MDKNTLDIERQIIKAIINRVHDESNRISDTCQRDIALLVRSRVPEGKAWNELDHNEINNLIDEFSKKLHKDTPISKNPKKRTIIRRSILRGIKKLLSDIWPFGE
ncbi:hypothetical protein TW85_00205 [Marinomonas sp. S3726]|uniref:hypothetical protein n=1 Tax=Marinomonas sp. S3726 TaxID=579484 RepID=UPI0005FA32B5|nr:hypothetical protein [Marinomonas sp. S3726]KJZ16444.1 hypothetical protein TW85_00205 [Marinomonas sp. S3726]